MLGSIEMLTREPPDRFFSHTSEVIVRAEPHHADTERSIAALSGTLHGQNYGISKSVLPLDDTTHPEQRFSPLTTALVFHAHGCQ
jgi:hypothetical protein